MENTVNQRIETLVNRYAEGNKAKFAKSIGVTATSFSNYVGERQSKPGYDVLKSILKKQNIFLFFRIFLHLRICKPLRYMISALS